MSDSGQLVGSWWQSLQPVDTGTVKLPGNRSALARLRRCGTPLEAAAEPETAALYHKLGARPHEFGRIAAVGAVLAHVRDQPRPRLSIARAIGPPPGGKPRDALVKPVRFKALMAARTDEEVMTAFRRIVALLGRTANVANLADLMLGWTDDEHGDRVRTRFAFDYHGAAFAAPSADADAKPSTDTAPEQE